MELGPVGGRRVSLRHLLPEADFVGADDIWVASCACDSRHVRPGDLFVALPGSVHDGHDFAPQATARGSTAVLAQRRLLDIDVPICVVSNTPEAYGRLCQALAGNPSRQIRVIGITGSSGKTTTSWLLASVLSTAGRDVGVLSTLGGFDGERFDPSTSTAPAPHALAAWLGRMVANGCSHAVIEVSGQALDQSRLAGVTLDAACVTNVRGDHLDDHGSIFDCRIANSRLLNYLSGEGFAVINADDPTSAAYLSQIDAPALTVGIRSAAEISATVVEQFSSEQTFLLTAGSETVPVRTRMIGTHHVYNCLMAAAVGLAYGIDLVTVVRGLEAVEQIAGRLQRLECGQPFGVFVDDAHTPDALAGCLRTLREVIHGRLICVFGAGGDRDQDNLPLWGRAVETRAHVAIVTSEDPRPEIPIAVQREVLRGFRDLETVAVIPDRAEAIRWALSQAQPGDGVLIAGKRHEKGQIVGQEQIPLDDCEVARQWLYQVQPAEV